MDMYQKRKMRAENKENNTEKGFANTSFSWYPGHMSKTRKQIAEDLKMIDVVIEVTDARIPYSSRNPDIEDLVKDKKKIIILNKKDLADKNSIKMWVDYYKKIGITAIPTEASKKDGRKEVIDAIKLESQEIVKKYGDKGRSGRKIKVMVFGIPNVGKSTFINMLANKNSAKVENKPGVTKKKQWIRLREDIELMDTPGMLWPKIKDESVAMNLAFTNSMGQNAFDNEEIAFYLLKFLCQNYQKKIEDRYGIKLNNKDVIEIREEIARKKGCILRGNEIDEAKVSNMILNDFQSGKIGRISIENPKE